MIDFEQDELNNRWKSTLLFISASFGEIEDIKDITFLIGVQELGSGFRAFSKDEKIDLIHVGVCRLLSDFGYYEYIGRDRDGWPHYELVTSVPEMKESDREELLKRAIVAYFDLKE